jgi:nucleotidyltransferase AbiEii toxin of type IV toxin-antitoxin system
MLHNKAVKPDTLSLLKRLQQLPGLVSFALVGGTALALKFGHRLSVDIDLFGENLDKKLVINSLRKEFGSAFYYEDTRTEWAIFCFINNIKVDIIQYNQPLVAPSENIAGIRILSTEDIAAMKINAILGRANKKDFWDLYELLHHYELDSIINAHQIKYPEQILLISIPQALSYFDDAEESEDPICLKGHTWHEIKEYIKKSISDYLK